MRIWFAGPRLGFFRPGVSFNVGGRRPQQRAATPAASDFVYVITGAHGLTKVGISTDPVARLATLQTGSPERLWLAFTAPGYGNAFTIEQEAHRILSAHSVSGEWFNITPDLAIAAIFGAADRTGCSISTPPIAAEKTEKRDSSTARDVAWVLGWLILGFLGLMIFLGWLLTPTS